MLKPLLIQCSFVAVLFMQPKNSFMTQTIHCLNLLSKLGRSISWPQSDVFLYVNFDNLEAIFKPVPETAGRNNSLGFMCSAQSHQDKLLGSVSFAKREEHSLFLLHNPETHERERWEPRLADQQVFCSFGAFCHSLEYLLWKSEYCSAENL